MVHAFLVRLTRITHSLYPHSLSVSCSWCARYVGLDVSRRAVATAAAAYPSYAFASAPAFAVADLLALKGLDQHVSDSGWARQKPKALLTPLFALRVPRACSARGPNRCWPASAATAWT